MINIDYISIWILFIAAIAYKFIKSLYLLFCIQLSIDVYLSSLTHLITFRICIEFFKLSNPYLSYLLNFQYVV